MRNEERKAHLVGSGIANLAAAAYLIKDGGFDGANINIYEEESLPGGSLVSAGSAEKGYFRRGERIFEENYVCMYDLLSFIPSWMTRPRRSSRTRIASGELYPPASARMAP